jgi:transposase-like protein
MSNWQSSAFKTNSPTSRQGGRSNLDFAEQHPSKLHGTNPLDNEVKRRADVVRLFPDEAAIVRLIRAVLLEQNG